MASGLHARLCLALGLLAALLLAGSSPVAQQGSSPSERVAQAEDGEERGIGGTGLGDDESGIGGTGLGDEGSGVGGTGIFGTITAFGSVWVNGLRVELAPGALVEIDGAPARAEELAVGEVAWIEAVEQEGGLAADSVSVFHAVAGPLGRVDVLRGEIELLGQLVEVPEATPLYDRLSDRPVSLSELRAGEFLLVSGLRRPDDRVVASRIEVGAPAAARLLVPAPEPDARTLSVGNLWIELAPEERFGDTERGRPLLVEGRWRPEQGVLEDAHVVEVLKLSPRLQRVSLEGYVQERVGPDRLRIHGLEVDASAVRGELGTVDVETRVWVAGRVTEAQAIRVERIVVEPPRTSQRAPQPMRGRARKQQPTLGDAVKPAPGLEPSTPPVRVDRPEPVPRPDVMLRPEPIVRPERVLRPEPVVRPDTVVRPEPVPTIDRIDAPIKLERPIRVDSLKR